MTSEKTGRNDPCPCGSGKKYKSCHWGQSPEEVEAGPPDRTVPAIIGVLGLVATAAAWATKGWGFGVTVAVTALLFLGGYLVLRNPPPPDPAKKDSGSINFGN